VNVAHENFILNHVMPHIDVFVAARPNHPSIVSCAPYGLVMANILAKPLLEFASFMRPLLTPGGYLILSGMLHRQSREMIARYGVQGFVLEKRILIDEWTTLLMRRT
jgi:ribosomal protein L11 methyltransferase